MGEVINFNKARKALAKAQAGATAKTNRAAHGRTKAEKGKTAAEQEAASRLLDAAKRQPTKGDDGAE